MKPFVNAKPLFFLAFVMMAFAQWLVPGNMIWERSSVLKNGKTYKFQSMPVDPVNPFKGRYVALNFAETRFRATKDHGLSYGDKIYVTFNTNDSGFAKIKTLHKSLPPGADYIKAKVGYIDDWNEDSVAVINIDYPFEEYYTEEFKAPKIERLYIDTAMRAELTYALVKVYKGNCVIENLFINNKPVEELLK